jgi:hypothetical protein
MVVSQLVAASRLAAAGGRGWQVLRAGARVATVGVLRRRCGREARLVGGGLRRVVHKVTGRADSNG